MIEIWTPRYHDNVVLIATYKVQSGDNLIRFTKAKHLQGKVYKISGSDIRSCPLDDNGRISCFAVPLEKLTLVSDHEFERKA